MENRYHYATVSDAISDLKKRGFVKDFNLKDNCIVCHPEQFSHDEFEIVEVYRYEGNTDPADEATVYAIESTNGSRGVLVTGYGAGTDTMSTEILRKLSIHK